MRHVLIMAGGSGKRLWPLSRQGMPKQLFAQSVDPASIVNIGSPQQVVEKILHQHEVFGHQRYLAQIDFGGMPYEKVMGQIETIGSEIIPAVKKYTAAKTEELV